MNQKVSRRRRAESTHPTHWLVCAQAIHLRTNIEFENEYLQRHKRARHCTDLACWARVADIMLGCAPVWNQTVSQVSS